MFKAPNVFPDRSGKIAQKKSSYEVVRDAFASVFAGDLENENSSLVTNDYYGSLIQAEMFPMADSVYSSSNLQYGNEPPDPTDPAPGGGNAPPNAPPAGGDPPPDAPVPPPSNPNVRVDQSEFYWFMSVYAKFAKRGIDGLAGLPAQTVAWFDAAYAFYYSLDRSVQAMLERGDIDANVLPRSAYAHNNQPMVATDIPLQETEQTQWLISRMSGHPSSANAPTAGTANVPRDMMPQVQSVVERSFTPAFVTPASSPVPMPIETSEPGTVTPEPDLVTATSTAPTEEVDTSISKLQTSVDAEHGRLKPPRAGVYGMQAGYGGFWGGPNVQPVDDLQYQDELFAPGPPGPSGPFTKGWLPPNRVVLPQVQPLPVVAEARAQDHLFRASVNRNAGPPERARNSAFVPVAPAQQPRSTITGNSFAANNRKEERSVEEALRKKARADDGGTNADDDEVVEIFKVRESPKVIDLTSSTPSSRSTSRASSSLSLPPSSRSTSRASTAFSDFNEPPPAGVNKRHTPPTTLPPPVKKATRARTPLLVPSPPPAPAVQLPTSSNRRAPTSSPRATHARSNMQPGPARAAPVIAPRVPTPVAPVRRSTPIEEPFTYPRGNNFKQLSEWNNTRLGWYREARDLAFQRYPHAFKSNRTLYLTNAGSDAKKAERFGHMKLLAKFLAELIQERGPHHPAAMGFFGTGIDDDSGIDKNAVRIILGEIEAGNNNPALIYALQRAMKM